MRSLTLLTCLLLFCLAACTTEDPERLSDIENLPDTSPDTHTTDISNDTAGDAADTPPLERFRPVPIDLGPYLPQSPDPSANVRAFVATTPAALLDGPGARGRVGDIVLENEVARFLIESNERVMSPCPYGGNVIDAHDRNGSGDVLGEICPLLNAQQTIEPLAQEILEDGSQGYAVVAVTGRAATMDFFDVRAMLGAYLGPAMIAQMEIFSENLLPITATTYYVLSPGEASMQVVTAFRNDGDARQDIVMSHVLYTEGDGAFYNPLSRTKGFGNDSDVLTALQGDRLPLLAFITDEGSFAYVPQTAPHLQADLPIAGSYTIIAGVVATMLGRTDFLQTLLAKRRQLETIPGVMRIEPGDVETSAYRLFVGDRSVATMMGGIYDALGVETGRIEGSVVDEDGSPLAGARVSAVDHQDRAMNQAITDDEGRFALDVPPGDYQLLPRLVSRVATRPVEISVAASRHTNVELELARQATLEVVVTTPDDAPTAARVSLICVDACPHPPTSQVKDVTFDYLPEGWAAIAWAGLDGKVSIDLVPGDYHVVVSRGMEWSLWPADAPETGGALVTLEPGKTLRLDAEIARVIDTTGALSADFHVHAISSQDSPVPQKSRVLSLLAEGVDVIVSTDHDVIADYGPDIEALGAGHEIRSIVGTEITTSVLGHFNAFPLVQDQDQRRGGALDWGAGGDHVLTPSEIFAWAKSHPGEQVVQINHPRFSYFLYSDVLRGLTYGDPTLMRINVPEPEPDTGETGFWSDDFSAMEIMNGHKMGEFWITMRWWLTLVGRGKTVTATAVTDTHRRYRNTLGGVPRSYVFVPEVNDTPATFDLPTFAGTVNAGRVLGTNGPFVRVLARNANGAEATLGDVLPTDGAPVEVDVIIETTDWMQVDRLDVYMNADGVVMAPGVFDESPLSPTLSVPITFNEGDLEVVATGNLEHRRYRKTMSITLETDADAYVVFVVRGDQTPPMFSVVPALDLQPFAFTNPLFLDADGGGYDTPHLAELARTSPPYRAAIETPAERPTIDDVQRAFQQAHCSH